MGVAKKARAKVEALTESVSLLHKHLKELGELVEIEECTPAEYKALLRAEQAFFELNREVLRVLYAIKGRNEDNAAEALRRFLDGVEEVIRYMDETLEGKCSGERKYEKN